MGKKLFPMLEWLPHYSSNHLRGDIIAGLILFVMLIPQSMAYAMIAGLPPVYGLYASTIPLFMYAVFASSRHLSPGPVALDSILVFSGVSLIAMPGSDEYIAYALLLAFMVGALQLLFGLLKVGQLVKFVSKAVISGFTAAAAIIIGTSQFNHLLGITLEAGLPIYELIWHVLQQMNDIHLHTLFIGIASIGLLIGFKRLLPRFPAPIVVVLVMTAVVYGADLHDRGVAIVGDIPAGLPLFQFPAFEWEAIRRLFPIALTIAFIAYIEAISIAKRIAMKEQYELNPNQEFKALGMANIAGSFFSSFPIAGSFSRTAVNYQNGGKTQVSTIITASMLLLALLFLTPLFYYLPLASLAAIIIVAVFGLIDVQEAKHLFRVKRLDGWVLIITFLSTLLINIQTGIVVGVVVSLLLFIRRSAYPHMAELGYMEKEGVFRSIERYPQVKTFPGAIIWRVDASLYFANMTFLKEKLTNCLQNRSHTAYIILDMSGVNDIDAVAVDELEQFMEKLRIENDIEVLFTNMKGPVRDIVYNAKWPEKYGQHVSYLSIKHALTDKGLWRELR